MRSVARLHNPFAIVVKVPHLITIKGVGAPAFTGRHEFEFFILGSSFRRGGEIGLREKREGFADGGQTPEGLRGGVDFGD